MWADTENRAFIVCAGRWCRTEYNCSAFNGEPLRGDKLRAKLRGSLLRGGGGLYPSSPPPSPQRDMGPLRCVGLAAVLLMCTGKTSTGGKTGMPSAHFSLIGELQKAKGHIIRGGRKCISCNTVQWFLFYSVWSV